MSINPGKHELLDDVLAEAAPPDFRSELLDRVLGEARYQRKRRVRNRILGSTALVAVLIALAARLLPSYRELPAPKPDPLLVHSQPLNPAVLVATQPQTFLLVHSTESSVAMVQTSPSELLFSFIGDPELFSMLGGRPAVLVCRGPVDCDLVLLNPEDRNGFPIR
jgi:hypothetical protein